ncbi:MAG: ParB/RepB/Spo0J family partition protein [Rhodothermales bacterium]
MASRKAVLGRGLNALLPSQQEQTTGDGGQELSGRVNRFEDRVRLLGRVAEIDVRAIRPNPYQPRESFDETALDELAASIRQLGIIQPITVRVRDEGEFELISGERRLRAARRAGIERVPAFVRDADTEEMLEMALVENFQREELNPVEIAIGYQRLIEECDLTQEQVAAKVGKNRATITNFLRLLKLPPRIQASLRDGSVSMGHARALISVDDPEMQNRLLQEVIEKELSVRQVEERVRKLRDEATGRTQATPEKVRPDLVSLQVQEFTSRLRMHLSTQVQIKHRGKEGGRIEIAYYSDDDLERILETITHR